MWTTDAVLYALACCTIVCVALAFTAGALVGGSARRG